MRYANARPRICNSDLVAIRKRTGFLANATRLVTRSPYTHTAVAVWVQCGAVKRLLVAEEKASGCFLTPLSQYRGIDFDVFSCPTNPLIVQKMLWGTLGSPIGYDYTDLARIAANRLAGVPLPDADNTLLVCSSLSATLYLQAGWEPESLPSIPAPDDLVKAIGYPPKLTVRKD